MIAAWEKYGQQMAWKFWSRNRSYVDLEDCYQAATIGLWEAARRFQPSKGFSFGTYATHWIRQQLQRAKIAEIGVPYHWIHPSKEQTASEETKKANFELAKKVSGMKSLNAPVRIGNSGGESSLQNDLAAVPAQFKPEFPEDFWYRVNKFLDPVARQIIRLRFHDDLTLEEAGMVLGMTRGRVWQLEARALLVIEKHTDFGDCLDQFHFTPEGMCS